MTNRRALEACAVAALAARAAGVGAVGPAASEIGCSVNVPGLSRLSASSSGTAGDSRAHEEWRETALPVAIELRASS
jgi:hypothetical protein